jgi:hypothetical protein
MSYGCKRSGDVETSYVNIVSSSVKTVVRTATKYCTKDTKIMAAKVGPLAARSPYQPPNKPSTSIQARPQAKHSKALLKRLRFVTKTLPPYVTNVFTGS